MKTATAIGLLCSVLAIPAFANMVMPFWQNDNTAYTISFNDSFGNQITIGSYDPLTGVWTSAPSIHLLGGSTPPGTPTTCGTSPPVPTGSDTSFTVTTGSSATTACTIPFGIAFISAPICIATPVAAANGGLFVASASNVELILNYSSGTSLQFNVQCVGLSGG